MFGYKNKYGFSFSLNRLPGISSFKSNIARKTDIHSNESGLERKIGRAIIRSIFGK